MSAVQVLADLRRAGFHLSMDGNRLMVAPAAMLTDGTRATIRENRTELVSLLSGNAAASPQEAQKRAANDPAMPEGAPTAARARRLARFAAIGLDEDRATRLADRLDRRDVEADDRRVCAECTHLGDSGRCIAAAAGRINGADRRLEPVPDILQHCQAFGLRKGLL